MTPSAREIDPLQDGPDPEADRPALGGPKRVLRTFRAWTVATTTTLGNRTTTLEVGQRALETRVTRLESRRKKPH